jgi:CRISPR/Cas system CSM-associated protein Csm3 (group 7 of RAMP superfamily)
MVLETLTTLRRQTAMDAVTGAPQQETLRTIRVVLRNTTFTARLDFLAEPSDDDKAFLVACVKGLRRVGGNRNRGLGRVVCDLYKDENLGERVTDDLFAPFRQKAAPV